MLWHILGILLVAILAKSTVILFKEESLSSTYFISNVSTGILEKPAVPPSFNQIFFKLAIVGKSGVGKTSLVSLLSNQKEYLSCQSETPGIRVTTVFWPAKIREQIFLFHLDLWDAGETATKKYNHILPVTTAASYHHHK